MTSRCIYFCQPGALSQLQPDILPLVIVVIVKPPLIGFEQHIAGIGPQGLLTRDPPPGSSSSALRRLMATLGHHGANVVLTGVMR